MRANKRVGELNSLSKKFTVLVAISFIVFWAYSACLANDFVNWDDDVHLLRNKDVQALTISSLKNIFSKSINSIYVPLTTLSFALEYAMWEYQPLYYHLNNVLLHVCVTGFVFLIAFELNLSLLAASIAALIFGLHPIHVESVAWITERKDVLSAFFYLLSLVLYFRYLAQVKICSQQSACDQNQILDGKKKRCKGLDGKSILLFILVAFSAVLSVLAKPMGVSLPLILFLIDWKLSRRFSWQSVFEKFILFLFILPVVYVTFSSLKRVPLFMFPESILLLVRGFAFYIRKFFWPDFFTLFYELPLPIGLSNPVYIFSFLLIVFLCFLGIRLTKARWFHFAFLFYFFSIFFLLRMDLRGDLNIVSDRFLYLPSIGFCLFLGYWGDRLWAFRQGGRFKKVSFLLIFFVFLSFFVFRTQYQCKVWRNGLSLWEHQLKTQPKALRPLALNKWAEAAMARRGFVSQLNKYQEFMNNSSKPVLAKDTQLMMDNSMQHIEIVIDRLKEAVRIEPRFFNSYYNLGRIYFHLDLFSEAKWFFLRAQELDPTEYQVLLYLGKICIIEGDIELGKQYFSKALNLSYWSPGVLKKVNGFLIKNQIENLFD